MLKSGQLSVLEIAQMVGHTNTKMILERYAKFIKGEHLKIQRDFDPFKNGVTTLGDTRGDTLRRYWVVKIAWKFGEMGVWITKESEFLVAGEGFEPPTFGLWVRRATELLYPAIL